MWRSYFLWRLRLAFRPGLGTAVVSGSPPAGTVKRCGLATKGDGSIYVVSI